MKKHHFNHVPDPEQLLSGYLSFLIRHKGFSSSAYRQYRKVVMEFLAFLGNHNISLPKIQVKDLDNFIIDVAEWGFGKKHMEARTTVLRGFLRYLFGEGWLKKDLSRFVESPRLYRDATVPPHFTWPELQQLIASVKGHHPKAARDRAMLVLLCVYGLRSSEVAMLKLDDIDWTHKHLNVSGRKDGSFLMLPLLPAVEAVLTYYIRKCRPSNTPYREILLKNSGRPLGNGHAITDRLRILVKKAGLKGGRGCHAIRRAVGTRLVENGRGLSEVAATLGHKNLKSAQVYLRLSMEFLRDVADNYGEML